MAKLTVALPVALAENCSALHRHENCIATSAPDTREISSTIRTDLYLRKKQAPTSQSLCKTVKEVVDVTHVRRYRKRAPINSRR